VGGSEGKRPEKSRWAAKRKKGAGDRIKTRKKLNSFEKRGKGKPLHETGFTEKGYKRGDHNKQEKKGPDQLEQKQGKLATRRAVS